MISAFADPLLHESRRTVGRIFAMGRLHWIRRAKVGDLAVILKSRRPLSRFAIVIGNKYLRFQNSEVEILNDQDWLRWECSIESQMNTGVVYLQPPSTYENFHGLVSHVCRGQSLRDILVESSFSINQKFEAIGLAMNALFRLHSFEADWGNEVHQSISHGDATVNNVIIDLIAKTSQWIDFDTRHVSHLSALDRQADDMRALLYSVASHLPQQFHCRLVSELVEHKPQRSVVNRLGELLRCQWHRFSAFQLAQAPIPFKILVSFTETLLNSIAPLPDASDCKLSKTMR